MSFYGTFDQGGNVWEWNETVINSIYRGFRGGSWGFLDTGLKASYRGDEDPQRESREMGFRIASVITACAAHGELIEGIGEVNDFSVSCHLDDIYWAAHGETFEFQVADPVVQFQLTSTVPNGIAGVASNVGVQIDASKENENASLLLRAQLFNFASSNYESMPGTLSLTTSNQRQTFGFPGGSDPNDFINPDTSEIRVLIQTLQTSGLPNVRTQLDQVLFFVE